MNKEVMIGTWAWGAGYNGSRMVFGKNYDESTLKSTFDKATKLGFLKWDTAAVYGMGACERLLGGLKLGAVQNHFSLLRNDQQTIIDYCNSKGIQYYAYMVLEQGSWEPQ